MEAPPAAGPKPGHAGAGCKLPQRTRRDRGINYLFEVFFTQGLGGVPYGDGQRLVVGGDKSAAYQGLCEIDVIDGADTAGDAAVIARRIAEMVKTGFAVRSRGGCAPAGMRTSVSCCAAARALPIMKARCARRAFRSFADSAADLLDEPHIRPFAALLRVIEPTRRRTFRWQPCC